MVIIRSTIIAHTILLTIIMRRFITIQNTEMVRVIIVA